MKERPLIAFTLLIQAAVGASWGIVAVGHSDLLTPAEISTAMQIGWPALTGMTLLALVASSLHLKVPHHAWRGITNLRTSWLSREIFAVSAFAGSLIACSLACWIPQLAFLLPYANWSIIVIGLVLLLCMSQAYRLGAVKAWNTPCTQASFLLTTALLGGLILGVIISFSRADIAAALWKYLALGVVILAIASVALALIQLKRFAVFADPQSQSEQRAMLRTRLLTNCILVVTAALLLILPATGILANALIIALVLSAAVSEYLGRSQFYASQIPDGFYGFTG